MKNYFRLILLGIMIAWLFACKREKMTAPPVTVDKYFPKVKLIVQSNCTVSCHAPSLGYPQGLPVVLESDSDIVLKESSILKAVAGPFTTHNKRMPPSGALSNSDIDVINQWIFKGGSTTD